MSSRRFGIVVGVDGSPRSAVAVNWAARDAELRHVPLTLVHAAPHRWAGRRAHRVLDDALAVAESSRRAGGPPKLITKIASRNPVATLVELSRDAELLVVGAQGRRSGSISAKLVGRSHCAVAVIHDADPLMPHPARAPVLLGVDSTGHAHRQAREESRRRGVARAARIPAIVTE